MSLRQRIRVGEVANILGCSKSTVWAWVRKGHIPEPHRVETRFSFWIRTEIEALVIPAKSANQ